MVNNNKPIKNEYMQFIYCYLMRKCMKRTMLRKKMDKPQPTWVMMVRLLRSELEMVSFRGVCKGAKNTKY